MPQSQELLPEILAAMQNMQLHALQAARYARQVQQLSNSYPMPPDYSSDDSDADDDSEERWGISCRARSCANRLLEGAGLRELTGMSAAAAAQLQQGLPAGRCGAVVLHRVWGNEAVGEYMYPQSRRRDYRRDDEW
jgi:hypothetical protein